MQNQKSVLIDENIPFLCEILSQKFNVVKFSGRDLDNHKLKNSNCFALFVRSTTKVNSELLTGTSVQFVATATSGSDHIDKEYLSKSNIIFADALGSNSNSVAEYVIYSILHAFQIRQEQVRGRTIGIIGFGNIGSKLAYYSNKLGLKILVNDPPLRDSEFQFPHYCEYCELDDLMENSDIISNHVPLTTDTKYPTIDLLNWSQLCNMKPDVLFVHSSRGKIVNEADLVEFIAQNPYTQTVIDVFDNEPLINTYLAEHSIISTPHIAGYSRNGKLNGVIMVLDKFEKFIKEKFDRDIIEKEFKLSSFRGEFVTEDFIYQKIDEYRKISVDSDTFSEIFELDDKEKETQFDLQRKEYPIRFEYLNINN